METRTREPVGDGDESRARLTLIRSIDGVPRSVLALLIVSTPFALSLTVSPSSNVFEQMPHGLCTSSSSMASIDVAPIC